MFFNLFRNGSSKKETDAPKVKTTLKASEHLSQLTDAYISSEAAKQNVIKAIGNKHPKGYGELYSPIYTFSYFATAFFHFISFFIAHPYISRVVVFFGVSAVGFEIGKPSASLGAGLILVLMEWGQHATLNTLWNVYFQDGKKMVLGIAALAAFFSLFSIGSSGYSAYYYFSNSQYFIWGMLLSLGNEGLIISISGWRHYYEYKSAKESVLVNDLRNGYNPNHLNIADIDTIVYGSQNGHNLGKINGQKVH